MFAVDWVLVYDIRYEVTKPDSENLTDPVRYKTQRLSDSAPQRRKGGGRRGARARRRPRRLRREEGTLTPPPPPPTRKSINLSPHKWLRELHLEKIRRWSS